MVPRWSCLSFSDSDRHPGAMFSCRRGPMLAWRVSTTSLRVVTGVLLGALLHILSATAQQRPFLNEFMAANSGVLRDEDGDSSDWIEIYNPSENAVSLAGWF